MVVEVFKTNVQHTAQANMLVMKIRKINEAYQANFDLQDCDKILRVKSSEGTVEPFVIISLLSAFGFQAALLEDAVSIPSMTTVFPHNERLQREKFYALESVSGNFSKALAYERHEN